MNTENIFILLAVMASVFFVGRRIYKTATHKQHCSHGCGCEKTKL